MLGNSKRLEARHFSGSSAAPDSQFVDKALWCSTVNLHQLFALLAGAEISLYQTSSRADKQHDMALDAHYLA